MSFRFITPVPFASRVKSWLVPEVIFVPAPVKVNNPVEVMAPELIVPILVRLPVLSIL